jgi:hypothetical protein
MSRLGENESAHTSYSTAVSIHDNLAKGYLLFKTLFTKYRWLSWGLFCDHQFMETNTMETNESAIVWAEYSLNCYLQVNVYLIQ